LRVDDFEMEKQVIIEEIKMYDDQPPYGGYERIMREFYGDHPLGNSVLGTAETVGALTADQMMEYFKAQYSPSNICIAAAGKIDFDALVADVQRCCGGWEAFDAVRPSPAPNYQRGLRDRG